VPANATSTLTSLGGIYVETGTLALATDAILMSYQVPALPVAVGTTYLPNRRLRIDGVSVASGVTTAFATGGFSKFFYLAFGSTALSLAGVTADTVVTKAYRRLMLPIVQHYTATHAPGASNNASMTYFALQTPIFINPGEFVALCTFHQGVVGTVGVITHAMQFDFSWE
jgi:heme exporter protein D